MCGCQLLNKKACSKWVREQECRRATQAVKFLNKASGRREVVKRENAEQAEETEQNRKLKDKDKEDRRSENTDLAAEQKATRHHDSPAV